MDDAIPFTCAAAPLLPPVFDPDALVPDLPRELGPWPEARDRSDVIGCLTRAQLYGGWLWPERPVVFISDPHADAEGFLRSLTAAGVIRRDGGQIALTAFGCEAQVILGGDCLDKGPSNLELLDAVADTMAAGVQMTILAGNHDLRMRIAITSLRRERDVLNEHLFIRMGRKILPALREVFDRFVTPEDVAALPDEATCRARLLPRDNWAKRFTAAARGELKRKLITSEVRKLHEKLERFDSDRAKVGLSYREILAAGLKCHDVFFEPGGRYAWFFDQMIAAKPIGSLLFVHAGVCNKTCILLADEGLDALNRRYRAEAETASLGFYFGPLANLVRTKYRTSDCDLTDRGVTELHRMGIHMVVQGHVNNHKGQRLRCKKGFLHLEGDITLDRTSRQLEGLDGIGAGATLIYPSGDVIGLSRDYARAKHFAPDRMG